MKNAVNAPITRTKPSAVVESSNSGDIRETMNMPDFETVNDLDADDATVLLATAFGLNRATAATGEWVGLWPRNGGAELPVRARGLQVRADPGSRCSYRPPRATALVPRETR